MVFEPPSNAQVGVGGHCVFPIFATGFCAVFALQFQVRTVLERVGIVVRAICAGIALTFPGARLVCSSGLKRLAMQRVYHALNDEKESGHETHNYC